MAAEPLSKSQIDRLGVRLKAGNPDESDLRLLDAYRRSFGSAYELVVRTIRKQTKRQPTGRPAKSTTSIIEKLRRETIRLSQIQDIAGCRLLTRDRVEQNRVVEKLGKLFPKVVVIDRRRKTSHGYRAVHVIVEIDQKPIEIQVRSRLQHLWAEISEKLSDVVDPALKYGGGPKQFKDVLKGASTIVARFERIEMKLSEQQSEAPPSDPAVRRLRESLARTKRGTIGHLKGISALSDLVKDKA